MSGLSKYERMKKNLKKTNVITEADRKQRDRKMNEDSGIINKEREKGKALFLEMVRLGENNERLSK